MMNSSLNLSDFMLRLSSINQIVIYILSFPEPDMFEAPHFNEVNIMEFLHYFQHLRKKYGMNNDDLIKMLLNYYERKKRS